MGNREEKKSGRRGTAANDGKLNVQNELRNQLNVTEVILSLKGSILNRKQRYTLPKLVLCPYKFLVRFT